MLKGWLPRVLARHGAQGEPATAIAMVFSSESSPTVAGRSTQSPRQVNRLQVRAA